MEVSVTRREGLIILWVVSALYGLNPSFVKVMLEQSELPASACAALRFAIAGLFMSPALFSFKRERAKLKPLDRAASWCFAVELGAWLACGYGLQTVALTRVEPIEASIYLAFFLVLVPVFERFHGRQFSQAKTVALSVALLGLALLSMNPSGDGERSFHVHAGTVSGLLSSTMFALHLVRCEVLQRHVKSVLHLGAAQIVCCAALLCVWAAIDLLLPSGASLTPAEMLASVPWKITIFTAVFCTACCQTGELVAVSSVEASTAALSMSMITVWGMGVGILFKGNSLSLVQSLGGGCIVLSGTVPKLLTYLQDQRSRGGADKPDALHGLRVPRGGAHVVSLA